MEQTGNNSMNIMELFLHPYNVALQRLGYFSLRSSYRMYFYLFLSPEGELKSSNFIAMEAYAYTVLISGLWPDDSPKGVTLKQKTLKNISLLEILNFSH